MAIINLMVENCIRKEASVYKVDTLDQFKDIISTMKYIKKLTRDDVNLGALSIDISETRIKNGRPVYIRISGIGGDMYAGYGIDANTYITGVFNHCKMFSASDYYNIDGEKVLNNGEKVVLKDGKVFKESGDIHSIATMALEDGDYNLKQYMIKE